MLSLHGSSCIIIGTVDITVTGDLELINFWGMYISRSKLKGHHKCYEHCKQTIFEFSHTDLDDSWYSTCMRLRGTFLGLLGDVGEIQTSPLMLSSLLAILLEIVRMDLDDTSSVTVNVRMETMN